LSQPPGWSDPYPPAARPYPAAPPTGAGPYAAPQAGRGFGPDRPPPRRRSPALLVAGGLTLAGIGFAAAGALRVARTDHPVAVGTTTVPTTAPPTTPPPTTDVTTTTEPSPSTSVGIQFPVKYTDPAGKFTAFFEGKPTASKQSVPSPAGNLPFEVATYEGFDSLEQVGYLTLPSGGTYNLQAGLQGIADQAKGKLVSSQLGNFEGFPSDTGIISQNFEYLEVTDVDAGSTVYLFDLLGPNDPPDGFSTFSSLISLTP
jgi:hypothetical protein